VRTPTLRDVAASAGVHVATASRALNPQTRQLVNADTARRVIRAADKLGYRPNPIARGLKTAKSGTIGVVLPDLTNPLFPPIVRGIEDVLLAHGVSALIVNTDNDAEREAQLVTSLLSRQVEGLVVATALLDHPLLAKLREQRLPLVLVNRRTTGLDAASVTPDDAAGIKLAINHLADLGHVRVAHLAGPRTTSTGVTRANAFLAGCRERGLSADERLLVRCDAWSESEGARAFARLLDSGVEPTAVVAGNDLIALGCYDVLRERSLRCPERFSIVGFNNMPFLDKCSPPLTTIAVAHQQVGHEAARMLLELIDEPDRPARSVLIPPSLVIRGSTAPPHRDLPAQADGRR
jgi:LacI family transcriptional regulator